MHNLELTDRHYHNQYKMIELKTMLLFSEHRQQP